MNHVLDLHRSLRTSIIITRALWCLENKFARSARFSIMTLLMLLIVFSETYYRVFIVFSFFQWLLDDLQSVGIYSKWRECQLFDNEKSWCVKIFRHLPPKLLKGQNLRQLRFRIKNPFFNQMRLFLRLCKNRFWAFMIEIAFRRYNTAFLTHMFASQNN